MYQRRGIPPIDQILRDVSAVADEVGF